MGLLKAGSKAISGTLADQWKEYFYCTAMPIDVLASKGEKKVSDGSSNKKGNDNIISNGSVIAVNEGQCMMIVEQGRVVEFCAEPGEFIWDSSTEPSIFGGPLGQGIKQTFETIGKRFALGGDTGKDQRVYYFNLKEIIGNKYGTANPIPFRIVDKNIGLDMDIGLRCYGEYSYRMTDPMLFYKNVCGNVGQEYTRAELESQLKSEFLTALQPAFAKISELGIRYSAIPGHTEELAELINDILSKKWGQLRGIEVVSVGVNSVSADEEDEDLIKKLQTSAVLRNTDMAAAHLVGAQAEAMKSAAKNEGSGAFMAFAGMNMAQQAGGANAGALFETGKRTTAKRVNPDQWNCKCGAKGNSGKFCRECGEENPNFLGWICSCGTVNKGKFCYECGKPKPKGELLYRCDKCGWEPEDPTKPPKFCPECGDPFDENDIQ